MYDEQEHRRSALPIVIAVVLTAAVTFLLTSFFLYKTNLKRTRPSVNKPSSTAEESGSQSQETAYPEVSYQDKIQEIQSLIDYYYIGDVDDKTMGDAVAAGMIEGLGDEWSYYIPRESYEAYVENVSNSYVGIGVTITSEEVERGVRITDVTPESPAYRAGLEIGDVIVAVNGVPVLDGSENALDMESTKNTVRGKAGTNVTLTVLRDKTESDYTITRASIKVINVTSGKLEGDLTYIKIRNFEEGAAQDTIDAIETAMKQGTKGIVFDVRYNPGGLKRELVDLLDYLLPEGPLFRSVDYMGRENVDQSDASHIEIPMAVLVNYDSYSAAEFFAAALQEYEAAVIVGEQTYGKGRFQTALQLTDGSAINISIGEYTTPKGVTLVGKGITPDRVVDLEDEKKMDLYYGRLDYDQDAQLQEAVSVLRKVS